ncbi:GNAT family N-acetyltransferase [Dactylosporangium sp. NPDC050588]|uniref:GNAT family N-acetyltransferase n=1 Tax=Dactylosporangium sp. NPDC050588 TaxID=3157211 RepID=UPI0033CDDAA1
MHIESVDWDDAAAVALREAMAEEVALRYPDRFNDRNGVDAGDVVYTGVVYTADGQPVGHAALRRLGEDLELKRMYIVPAHRGTGVSTALLAAVEEAAVRLGGRRLLLQTGDRQPEAVRLYEKTGYTRIPIFPPYETQTYSFCFEKVLRPVRTATTVITGGTDGIGRALAGTYLGRGHHVVAIGTNQEKGTAFLRAADEAGAGDRVMFLRADLSLVAGNRGVIDRITERYAAIDVLILGARFHRSTRVETADGLESNFALYYLSRYLLSHGLAGLLQRAEQPVVLNFGGVGLTGPVRWDDLQLRHDYPGTGALGHSAALCDLLGARFAEEYGIPYVLNHPGVVATSFAGEYDAATAAHVEGLRNSGKPVAEAVAQILPFLDAPPAGLTAVLEGRRIPFAADPGDAARLDDITRKLLAAL